MMSLSSAGKIDGLLTSGENEVANKEPVKSGGLETTQDARDARLKLKSEEADEGGDRKRLNTSCKTAIVPGKPRGATYDGNVCLVCGDRASGLHYGVLACEGCKGFFKRVCKEKLCPDSTSDGAQLDSPSQKRQCLFGGNCEINMRTRNRCQYCRIQKCIELGMSKDGIKLGRRSKNFKQNLDYQQAVTSLNSALVSQSASLSKKEEINIGAIQLPFATTSAVNVQRIIPNEHGKQLIGIIQNNALIFKSIDVIPGVDSSSFVEAKNQDLISKGQSSVSNLSGNSKIPAGGSVMPALILNNSPSAILMINASTSQTVANEAGGDSAPASSDQEQQPGSVSRTYPILIYHSQPNVIQSSSNQIATSSTTAGGVNRHADAESVAESTSIYSMLNESEISNIVQATYQAYRETNFDYNGNGQSAETPIEQDIAQSHDVLRHFFSNGLIEFLKGSKFLDHFNVLIENAVLFAKNTPYFMNINETDRITLLKSCVFQVICVRHANFFFSNLNHRLNGSKKLSSNHDEIVELATNALITPAALTDRFLIPIYNSYVTRSWFAQYLPRMNTLIDHLFDFYKLFQLFELNDTERSLFCAYLLFNTDNSTLVDYSDLMNYRELFGDIFLNTLVKKVSSSLQNGEASLSSKDLSNKIRTWITECYSKLKQIDVEHAKLLNEYKSFVVWPDLYSELYNL